MFSRFRVHGLMIDKSRKDRYKSRYSFFTANIPYTICEIPVFCQKKLHEKVDENSTKSLCNIWYSIGYQIMYRNYNHDNYIIPTAF